MCLEIDRALSYPYARGAGSIALGQAAFLRGDLETAKRHADEAVAALPPHREVQAAPYQMLLRGWIARAKGDDEEELRAYLEGNDIIGDEPMLGMADELLSETVRALVRRGQSPEGMPHLEVLRAVARDRPNAEASRWWAEGVISDDPNEREEKLRAAAERFRSLGRPIDEARCLLDLADVVAEPESQLERARELLVGCGAVVYLREVDARSAEPTD
jgi:hypothetical protein